MSEKVYVNICDTKKCPGPVYAVKTGDTLYSIAQRHHCRVRTLLDLNPFVNVSMTFEELAKVNRILYNLTVPAGTILLVPAKKE